MRGGWWQAKAGDSQGKGDRMKDRQQIGRFGRHRVGRTLSHHRDLGVKGTMGGCADPTMLQERKG